MKKTKNSSKLLKELYIIKKEKNCTLFEAASIYCEIFDIEPEDFLTYMDKNTLQQIKNSAINNKNVRKKYLSKQESHKLNFLL